MDKFTAYNFLEKLSGSWDLNGKMGEIPLKQTVESKYILGGLFMQVYFSSTLFSPNASVPYEAVYLIGYNAEEDLFVLNLFDTFGVAPTPIPGHGKLKDNKIEFVFNYVTGQFINKFEYNESIDTWNFTQYYFENGIKKIFAEKIMVRK